MPFDPSLPFEEVDETDTLSFDTVSKPKTTGFDFNQPFEEVEDTEDQAQFDADYFRPKPLKTEKEKQEIGTLEGISNAAKNAFDSSRQAMDVVGGVTPEEAKNIAKIEFDKKSRKLAPGYDEYQKAEGMDAVWAFAKNPIEVTSNIIAEGLAGSLPALGAGLAAGGVGAAAGSVVPGLGTAAGFTAGQVAGTFAGSLATEYGGKVLEELQGEGMDISDPNSIQTFFGNEELVGKARDKALKRGVPIAAFDALSAGIGGKLGRVFGTKVITEGEKIIGKQFATKTGEALTELGVQAGLGGGGEIAGSLVAGEPIEGKAVFGEVIGEVGPGSIEVLTGRIADKRAMAKAQEDAKIKAAADLSTTLEENSSPLTASVVTAKSATNIEQDKLAAQLDEELTIQEAAAAAAQPPTTYATQEIIQPKGVRQEPQDGTQVKTEEAGVSRGILDATTSEEERQVARDIVSELQAVANNTATREQIARLSMDGLVDVRRGQAIINEDGEGILAQAQAPLPKLTPEARAAEVEATQVTPAPTEPTIGEIPQTSPMIGEQPTQPIISEKPTTSDIVGAETATIVEQEQVAPAGKTYAQLENEALDIQSKINEEAGVSALIGVSDDSITLSGLESQEKGKGTRALEIITQEADKNNTPVSLKAESKTGETQRLKRFYMRFGFVNDPSFSPESNRMIRYPNAVPAITPAPVAETSLTLPPIDDQKKIKLISEILSINELAKKVTQNEKTKAEDIISELTGIGRNNIEYVRAGKSKVFRNKVTGEYIKLITPSKSKIDDFKRQIDFLKEKAGNYAILPNIQPLILDQEGGGAFLLIQKPVGIEGSQITSIDGRSIAEDKKDRELQEELFNQSILGGAAQNNGILRVETDFSLKNLGLVVGNDGMVRAYGFDFDGVTKEEFDKYSESAAEIVKNAKPMKGVPLSDFSKAAQEVILSGQTESIKQAFVAETPAVTEAPAAEVAPATQESFGQRMLNAVNEKIAQGKDVFISTMTKSTKVNKKAVDNWNKAGKPLFKVGKDGNLYIGSGKRYDQLTSADMSLVGFSSEGKKLVVAEPTPAVSEAPAAEPTATEFEFVKDIDSAREDIKKNLIRFASGMSGLSDMRGGSYARAGHRNYGVGAVAGLLSKNATNELADRVINMDVHTFIDSGAFGHFIKEQKLKLEGKTLPPLNFDKILAKYDLIIDEINNANIIERDDYPRPLIVTPDKLGDQNESLNLTERYKNWIAARIEFNDAIPIIPIPLGQLTLPQAYNRIVEILKTNTIGAEINPNKFIVGIPSNATAVSKEDLSKFLQETKHPRIHFLGAAADKKVFPLIDVVAKVAPNTLVTADASPVRSKIANAGKEGKSRGVAIFDALYQEDDPNVILDSIKENPSLLTATAPVTPAEPAGISVGNRIKLGKSPQTYTVEEAIPQSEVEKANNEQFYSVKNERTGEVQVVEKADMKQVGGKRARKMVAEGNVIKYSNLPKENKREADSFIGDKGSLWKLENVSVQELMENSMASMTADTLGDYDIDFLIKSISKEGVKQPITMVRNPDGSIDLEGNHRVFAAYEAGLETIPAYVLQKQGIRKQAVEEKISKTALIDKDGSVISAPNKNHAMLMEESQFNLDAGEYPPMENYGFVTNFGRFVGQKEAQEIARNSRQVVGNQPISGEIVTAINEDEAGDILKLNVQGASGNKFNEANFTRFPGKAVTRTNSETLTSHPLYNAAKRFNNVEAAKIIVDEFVDDQMVFDVFAGIDQNKPAYIVPVLKGEADSMNMLPVALAEKLSAASGIPVWGNLIQATSEQSTGAGVNEKTEISRQFMGEAPPAGAQIIIVDDYLATGRTIASLENMTGTASAVATIAFGRYGNQYGLTTERADKMLQKANVTRDKFYEIYGKQPEQAITGIEAQAYILNGAAGESGFTSRFPIEKISPSNEGIKNIANVPESVVLFAGGGLTELGLVGIVRNGYIVEANQRIAEFYEEAHGVPVIQEYVQNVKFYGINGGHFHASPVCKNFSGAKNKKQITQADIELDETAANAVAQAITNIQPNTISIENVKQYKGSDSYNTIISALEKNGYIYDANVYKSSDFGAPTSRERLIIRAVKKGGVLPEIKTKNKRVSWYDSVKDIVNDLPDHDIYERRYPAKMMQALERKGIDLFNVREPLLISGMSGESMRWSNEPAFTLLASPGSLNIIALPGGIVKKVTARAMARMTGVPDSFPLPADEALAKTIVGNGIPPALTRSIIGDLIINNQKPDVITPEAVPQKNQYTYEEAVKEVDAHFGKQGIPEGIVIVNNTTDPDLEMKAGYFVNRGQIVINLAYIAKGENLGDIIDHELGHYIFGDPEFQDNFKSFWEAMTPEEQAEADRLINQFYNKETGAVQMEEKQIRAFMQLIQDSKAMPKWKQFLDKIKRWINEKLGTNLLVTDRNALAVLAAAHKRFKSGEQIVREIDSGVLKMAAEPRREQVASKKRGDIITTPEGIIKQTNEVLRKKFFDGSEVSDENTSAAWDYIEQLLDIESGAANALAGQINDIVDQDTNSDSRMGASLFSVSLANYAAKLQAQGDNTMISYLIRRINRMPIDNLAGGTSDIARALRARREYEIDGYKVLQTEHESKVERTTAALFGTGKPSEEQVDAVDAAIKASEDTSIGEPEEVASEIEKVEKRTGRKVVKKIEDQISGNIEEKRKAALEKQKTRPTTPSGVERQALSIIDQFARMQSDTLAFTEKQENLVRSIVQQDLRQRPDMKRKQPWTSQLTAKLIQAGASEAQAETISDLVWRQHEIKAMDRELKELQTAAEKGSLAVIIQRIKDTPLEEQQKPEWMQGVIREYLIEAGLSSQAADTAARLYESVIAERFAEAKQKAFEATLAKSAPWNNYLSRNAQLGKNALKKIQDAIRTGVLDPTQTTEGIIAKESGWSGFSKEQLTRIVQLDGILSDDANNQIDKAEAMSELNKIIVKAKMPVRFKDAIGAYYVAQALMGIPTLLVNIVSPVGFSVRNMITDIGRYAFTEPSRIPMAFETFLDSMKSWYNQTSYAFKNQIYMNDVVEYLQGQNVLRELFDKGKSQWAKGDYANGMANMLVGMTQITGRVLSSLDQGAISALENQNITRYAMEAMKQNNIPQNKRKEFANMILHMRRQTYMENVSNGMAGDRAGVLADLAVRNEIVTGLSEMGVRDKVLDSAINDALQTVGRNKTIDTDRLTGTTKKLSDEGILSYLPISFLENIASGAAKQGPAMQVFSKMLYGFALVPARVFHTTAWYSPYGFVRLAVDKYKKNKGEDSPYAMSLQTELQYKQRLTETIAGSVVMLGFAALAGSSTDDDDEEKFKIVITGNGPSYSADKQYFDAWHKKYKSYSINIVMGNTIIPINIGRGGEALFFPIMLAGALDDWKIKEKLNLAKKEPKELNLAVEALGSAFFALAQRGPYAAFTKPLFDASKDGKITEELVGQAGFFGKTFIPILGSSLSRNISEFINDPVERSSLQGAIYANTPIVGPWLGTKALNALGQPIRADDWGDKLFKLGVPVVFSFPKNTPENELNELILRKGSGPSIPTRSNAQKRFGDVLTDKEFETYVREYGRVVSDKMFKNRKKLENMSVKNYDDELEGYVRGYSVGDTKITGAADMAVRAVKRSRNE